MKCVVVCFTFLLASAAPAEDLSYFLPIESADYDPAIPTPSQFLGFKTGERHITHHQLVTYARRIAELSPRVTLREYGRSHGARPLLMLTITLPRNHAKIEAIRKTHRSLSKPSESATVDLSGVPAVINMGYTVHGDESSGANAVPVVLYHLAASRSKQMDELLSQVVVLMDPCLNPDGFNRFANWANQRRGRSINSDPAHSEHNQPWPGGRVNYYWFDLNRDWLPAVHPESRGRLREYHAWKPDVLLDFHEMGTGSTYFFQPGIPERANPLIPDGNIELTQEFARYHAQALDQLGSLYFTEEVFDDFYPGKGSSYPDLHGAVGILFEQASSRGHRQESPNGELSFAFTIRNQVATSLSSLKATFESREKLLKYRRDFHAGALANSKKQAARYHVFEAPADQRRLTNFAALLGRHDIRHSWLATERRLGPRGRVLKPGALVVPVRQPEYTFLRALIEPMDFERIRADDETTPGGKRKRETIFYDVSAWTIPLAYDLDQTDVIEPIPADDLQDKPPAVKKRLPTDTAAAMPAAYVLDWRASACPAVVSTLLREQVRVRVATKPFPVAAPDSEALLIGESRENLYGTIVIPMGIQKEKHETILSLLREAESRGVSVSAIKSGLQDDSIDLGSSALRPVEPPQVLMVVEGGVNRYSAGAAWHLLDAQVGMPVTLVPQSRLNRISLSRYNTVVLPTGSYAAVGDAFVKRLGEWLSDGGTLLAHGTAIQWVVQHKLAAVEFRSSVTETDPPTDTNDHHHDHRPYVSARKDRALELISGAIFLGRVDRTHPLGFGLSDDQLPLFRNNRVIMSPTKNTYSNPVICSDEPLLSGYCSERNRKRLAGSASVVVRQKGRGRVILMAEDPNFRGFWHGTERLFLNGIFFGSVIREP